MSLTHRVSARERTGWWLFSVAVVPIALVVAIVAAEGQKTYQLVSSSYPGPVTAYLSALLELTALLASTVCLGSAFYSAFLRLRVGARRMDADQIADLRILRSSSVVWLCAAVALVPVDAADSSGVGLSRLLTPGAFPYLVGATYLPRAWIAVIICSAVALTASIFARRWHSLILVLFAAVIGVLAPVVVNQVLVGPNHDFGSDAAIIGTPVTGVLAGILFLLLLRLLSGRRVGRTAGRRFFRVAAVGWVVVVGTTLIVCLFELSGGAIFATPTGDLFAARFALLACAGVAGVIAWRRVGEDAAVGRAVVPWLVCASVCIAAYLGLVEAMVKIAPPQYLAPTNVSLVFLGYSVTATPTPWALLLDWRVNILFLAMGVTAVALYGLAYARLRRRRDAWPVGRLIAWVLGWTVIVFTTSSGIGRYSTASFSIHMILHMSLNMLGPILLVLGGPITLALRVSPAHRPDHPAGLHEWITALLAWRLVHHHFNPLLVWISFVGSYWVLYFTNIFNLAMRYHWAHQLLDLDFLLVGYLFYSLVIGVDTPPRPLPHIGKLGLVFAAMPFHAFFGVIVMTSHTVIAKQFYTYLDMPWMTNLKSDQYLGGGIAWAAGELPLLIVIIALVTQWAKQDARLATRTDRHLDAGLDDSFEAYNAMLTGLANRVQPLPGGHPIKRSEQ